MTNTAVFYKQTQDKTHHAQLFQWQDTPACKNWAAAEALPCPILIVHLGLWLPALVLWLATEKHIFHTLLRGNAWEYLNKAGQATLIKQAPACTSPLSALLLYIYVFIIFAKWWTLQSYNFRLV